MSRTSPPQNNFASGEISPLLYRRFDYTRFETGLRTCRGFIPLRQGGVTRAPGTLFRGTTKGNARARLLDFEFAVNDAVTLEFTSLTMRVWRYGSLVMDGDSPFELTTPYDEASLDRLQWVQSADVIYLADGARPIQKLSRLALDNWNIAAFQPETGPFRTYNADTGLTVTASGETGSITLTASADLFTADHVGSLMLFEPTNWSEVPLWSADTKIAVGERMRSDGRVYQLVTGRTTGVNRPVHTSGIELVEQNATVFPDPGTTDDAALDVKIEWQYISDSTGVVEITAVASATSATATVRRRLPQSIVNDGTHRWAEGAWSAVHGYPATIDIYQQRLVAAATPTDPRTVWFSATGGFDEWLPGTDADSAFAYAISGQSSLNRIIWVQRARAGLHIGALGEEYSTRFLDSDQVVAPTTTSFGIDSSIGSAEARPLAPRGDPIFISKDRTRLFEIVYDLQTDANRALELSLPAQHLGTGGFAEMVFQSAPQRLVWVRRDVGDLAVMLYDPQEQVLGWATVPVAGGVVEALSVTSNATGTADILTMVVRRTLNGQTVRCVEEQAVSYGLLTGAQPISEAQHLFSAVTFVADPASATFSVPHLAGETVRAWTDINEYIVDVAADGTVTLPDAVGRATIGLFDVTHMIETLPVPAAVQDGSGLGRSRRMHAELTVAIHRSAAGRVQTVERDLGHAPRVSQAQDILLREIAADPTEGFSGVTKVPAPSGQASEVSVRILPVGGAPLTVTALVPTIEETR